MKKSSPVACDPPTRYDYLVILTKVTGGKSRLRGGALSDSFVDSLTEALIMDTVDRFSTACEGDCSASIQCALLFSPPEQLERAQRLGMTANAAGSSSMSWIVRPAYETNRPDINHGRNLTVLLSGIVQQFASTSNTITVIGSDSPLLDPKEFLLAKDMARERDECYICPATDGGYTMLTLCPSAIAKANQIFDDIHWSSPKTCIQQILSLRRHDVKVCVGNTYRDVDEIRDYAYFKQWGQSVSLDSPILSSRCPRFLKCIRDSWI
jgi:2-phospho-L-lactate guanylyltransferase (CobY/MobA/RfbA family)